jgi:hypothetical protein
MILPYENIEIVQFDIFGNEITRSKFHNMVVDNGLNIFRDHMISTAGALPAHHFTLGTGTTAAASTDMGLQSSAYTVSFTGSTTRAKGVTFQGSLYSTEGTGTTYKEIGIFTSSSELIGRALITPVLVKSSSTPTNELISWAFDMIASTT